MHEEEEEGTISDKKGEVLNRIPSSRQTGFLVSGSVVNVSYKNLTDDQIKQLSRGLKFSPIPRDIGKSQLKSDIEQLRRRMRLKWHYSYIHNQECYFLLKTMRKWIKSFENCSLYEQ